MNILNVGCKFYRDATVMKKNIMIVDNDESLLSSLEYNLSRRYGMVEIFNSSTKAKDFFKQGGRVDLVITDYDMPYLIGIELARFIKSIDPKVPIILFTACNTEDMKARECFVAVIAKPNFAELKSVIGQLLQESKEGEKN